MTLANIISLAINFITPFVLVRVLTQADYGVWRMIFVVVSTLHAAIGFNISNSAAFFIPRGELEPKRVLATIYVFNLVMGIIVLLVLWLLPGPVVWIFKSEGLSGLLPMAGLILLLWNLSRAMNLVPIALGRSAVSASFLAATESAKSVFILVPALLSPSLPVILAGFLVWSFLRALIAVRYFFHRLEVRWRNVDWKTLKRMLAYSTPYGLTSVIALIFLKYHQFLVGHFFDEAQFAIYAVGTLQVPLMMSVLESTSKVVTPKIAQLQGQGRHEEVIALSARSMVKLSALFIPVVLVLFGAAEEFITVFFTADYASAVPIFQCNLVELLLALVFVDPVCRAYEELKYLRLKIYGMGLLVMLVLGKPVVLMYGPIGAVMLTIGTYAMVTSIVFLRVRQVLGIRASHRHLLRDLKHVLRAALVGLAVLMLTRKLTTLLLLKVGFPMEWANHVILVAAGGMFALSYLVAFEGGFRLERMRKMTGLFG